MVRKHAMIRGIVPKLLVVIGFIAGLAALVWYMSRMPAPVEANRVSTKGGAVSVICPPEWEAKLASASTDRTYCDSIAITPIRSVGVVERFFAGRFRAPQDLRAMQDNDGATPGTFMGHAAAFSSNVRRKEFTWRVVFNASGQSYEVSLKLKNERDIRNSEWWPYVTSIKFNPAVPIAPLESATSAPTTNTAPALPASLPADVFRSAE